MVRVNVSEGVLEGEFVENEFAKYFSFRGIPYAAPPVGDLRFKAPRLAKPWNGVREAKKFGHNCYQYNRITGTHVGSEDCLYLNVYTPKITTTKLLPVMFWIHGGSFHSGSGDDDLYGPDFLVDHGVILVTFNYRLEVLGFLCLDSEDVPGNAGMKDQVAALKWVKTNISNFGGDPDNITIFGQSAGGAAVSYHLVSPLTKGLFRRAIQQSGTSINWWCASFEPRETALALARQLGCFSEDSKVLYEFFKKQPAESLINIYKPTILADETKAAIYLNFAVVDEKKFSVNEGFFHGDPYEVLQNGIHEGVEVIVGFNEDDGLICFKEFKSIDKMLHQMNNFHDFFVPRPMQLCCSASQQLEIGRRFKKLYFGDQIISLKEANQMIEYFNMEVYKYDIMQWANICTNLNKNKVYLYLFSCKSERNIVADILGVRKYMANKAVVCHGDDLPYMFPVDKLQIMNKSSDTYQLIHKVVKLWTNFAKYGNPTPDNDLEVQWLPYDFENQHYLDIGNQFILRSSPNKEEMQFWENIYREFLPQHGFLRPVNNDSLGTIFNCAIM